MTRVKRGTISLKRRKNILKQVKGYRFGRSTKERQAMEALKHAGMHAFDHRKDKKSDRRRLWQTKINASVRAMGISYSRLIDMMAKKEVGVDRKILANLAENNPDTFKRVIEEIQK
jgi:large subunit ribosomal protein L20